MAGSWS